MREGGRKVVSESRVLNDSTYHPGRLCDVPPPYMTLHTHTQTQTRSLSVTSDNGDY